eukprot:scaffold37933_cov201-Skeletonema_marinoi.AAC.1
MQEIKECLTQLGKDAMVAPRVSVCFKVVAIFYYWIFLHTPPEENDACEQNLNSRSECGSMLHYNGQAWERTWSVHEK